MLEALLRVQDFEAFETLLGLLARTPLGTRERRELLAEMYLRRGFAASAAEQWMAVCRREPDTRALLGLARVAVAQGMLREASDFAAAALSRDPDNEAAGSLLSQAAAVWPAGRRVRPAQGMSQLQEILKVSAKGVDDHSERKREAAHGLGRATRFQGENAI